MSGTIVWRDHKHPQRGSTLYATFEVARNTFQQTLKAHELEGCLVEERTNNDGNQEATVTNQNGDWIATYELTP
jgi:hypothetical protein